MKDDIKIIQFKSKEAKTDASKREEMVRMLEETLQSLREGKITGFIFVGRKKPTKAMKERGEEYSRDYFEYIVANALDIGLIGEIQVINNRLIALYDAYTDSAKDDDKEDE